MQTRFFMPETIENAVGLLADEAGYRCLAGGGLMVPALRDGYRPAGLISLKRLSALKGVTPQADGVVRIGAMTTHDAVSSASGLVGGNALVRQAAGRIAHPVIRNMATIGGTLCRANPSADYSCALLAAGAEICLRGLVGERVVAIDDFVTGDGATLRREDELLVAVTLPSGLQGSSAYVRFSRVDGDYPVVTTSARLEWADGAVRSARVAVGGCGPVAYRVPAAEAWLYGLARGENIPDDFFDAYVAAADPVSDLKGSAEYRRMLIPGMLRRALVRAFADGSALQ